MICKINILNRIFNHLYTVISRVFRSDNYISKIVYFTHKCSSQSETMSKHLKSKKVLADWIQSFNHTHFLTVRLPENLKTSNFEVSKEHLRKIMAKFESYLLGRYWNKRHLPFICFAEKGKGDNWHYHILFNAKNLTSEQIEQALDKTASFLRLPLYSMNLQVINSDNNCTNFLLY